jgi:hypothetical protein
LTTRREVLITKLTQIREDLEFLRDPGRRKTAANSLLGLHRLEVEIDGEIRALDDAAAEASVAQDEPGGPLGLLLRDTRRLRRAAEMKGSMVAATRLLEREQSLLRDLQAEALQAAEHRRLAQDQHALVDRFTGALEDMPEPLVRALLARVQARLAG